MKELRPATTTSIGQTLRRSWLSPSILALGAVAGLGACFGAPSTDELVSNRIVVTKYDVRANFGSFSTFAMADSIPKLSQLDAAPSTVVSPNVAEDILHTIADQLAARGYAQVARDQTPELGVSVVAIDRLRVAFVSTFGAGSATGPSDPAYWGEPGAVLTPSFGYDTIAWRSGSLVIELYDLRDAKSVDPPQVTIIWGAFLHGVIEAPDGAVSAPVDAIQQAFTQSPYLQRH
jgi:hypothetical protein